MNVFNQGSSGTDSAGNTKDLRRVATGRRSIMKYFLKCLLAGLMLFIPLCHAGTTGTFDSPAFGGIANTIASLGDTGVLKFVVSNIDIMGLIWATLKYAALFFIISLPVLFCCRKYRWFKRQNPIWDKLTYLYYLCIPIVFVAFGAVYGALSSAEQQASSLVKNELSPAVNQFLLGTLHDAPLEFYDLLANATPEDGVLILRKRIEDNLGKVFDSEGAAITGAIADKTRAFWQKLPTGAITFIVGVCADVIYWKLAGVTGTSRDDVKHGVKAIQKESFLNLIMQGGDLFGSYAAKKVAAMIANYRFLATLICVAILLVPVADILIARLLRKTRARDEGSPGKGESLPQGPASP
ncbi:MAG: hypothetical protein LBP58_03610 [Azoarcus sp.]|jgi:hypothetical protein|nr:hypothetical protein [Azoarcus sp.]